MDKRSFQENTHQSADTHTATSRSRRWLAIYLSWTAATLAGGAVAQAASPLDILKDLIRDDSACGQAHDRDPDRDRDHRFHKRGEHYRHRHHFHHGHDGNVDLAVRTLIDAKGNAVLEATTGTFDDGSVPPGAIEQVRVRMTHMDRKHKDELNFNPKSATGYFSAPLGKLPHGQALTVDASISGIDRGRDKVSVDDTVQYRPDLSVGRIDVPASATMGLPTSISATVRETMGDVGATADCILSADGAVVDRVSNIWVDAAGVVSCHFSATFAAVGAHRLHVDVGNVRPGDYDMSNNGADAMVNIAPNFMFSANAYDATYSGTDVTQVLDSSGNVLYNENDSFSGAIQSASLNGSWGVPLTFPLASVSAQATSAGATWSLVNLTNLAAGSSSPSTGTCAAASDTSGFNWVTICSGNINGAPATTITVSEFAGDVTYHSDGVCAETTAMADCSGGFTWNNDSTSVWAPRHPFSGNVTMNLNVTDATGATLQAFPVLPLAPYTSEEKAPTSCDPQPDQTQNCMAHTYVETGVKATVNQ